jgi:geranylgeranyl diphosphate synthase, type II
VAERGQGADAMALLRRHAARVDEYLKTLRPDHPDAPPELWDTIDYSLLAPGKRIRPALVLECYSACAGRNADRTALAAAGAIELVHTFSLVHDDLPAMDDDDLRRGRATNHKVFGEAMAILAGDAMLALAFEAIAEDAETSLAPTLILELARATGTDGMIGGQVLDIKNQDHELDISQLQRLHGMKTGALLTCACRMGAIAASAPPEVVTALTDYGRHMGLAFQIMDDLLDATSTPEQLGKRTMKDQAKGKNTYPKLLGLHAARDELTKQTERGVTALLPLGGAAEGLRSLARFIVERSN